MTPAEPSNRSAAEAQQLGVHQTDFGLLFHDTEYLDSDDISSDRLIQPKIEAEIAFIVGRDLRTPNPSYGEFVASLAYAVPAIEMVDSAIKDWKITLADTVADNASSGLFVLGNQPRSLGHCELGEVGMQLDINGITVSVGGGAACLGHPLRAAYWLARVMAARGDGLCAGEVILSGALGPMASVQPSDLIHARIGGLGSVGCRLA